ncbi:MAG TPA: hypothetical protein VG650_14095 [Mycobacteriales bacterium]|nr:hypothetical protein [Mycobacteriales bacterium]
MEPDTRFLAALDEADRRFRPRDSLINGEEGNAKIQWSNKLADACARMIAAEVRRHQGARRYTVLPDAGGSEPPVFVAGSRKKKVDVTVSSLVSGLQIGLSLKGLNFRDRAALNYDKNLTGRTYELQDELRVIHDYQAAAFIVGVYFMPVAATTDKRGTGPSSFAHTVAHLRARTGRIDPSLGSQRDRADLAVVALYSAGDREHFTHAGQEFRYDEAVQRGVVRFFNVEDDPPQRGRPKLGLTMDLDGFVDSIFIRHAGGGQRERISYSEPEPDE